MTTEWNLYLSLRKKLSIVYSFKVTQELLSILDDLVPTYLDYYKKTFSDESITPRMHYMTHYSNQVN